MMFPANRVRIMVATKPIDFRKGHDGLAALVSSQLRKDPFTGTVFVFRSRKADRLKLLFWDGTGLVMAYKRLVDATFTWPAATDGGYRAEPCPVRGAVRSPMLMPLLVRLIDSQVEAGDAVIAQVADRIQCRRGIGEQVGPARLAIDQQASFPDLHI